MRGITGISCSCQGHSLSRATLHCEFLWACFVEWTGQLSAAVSCPALPPSLSTLSNNLRDTAVATANVVDVCTNRATTAHNLLHQLHRWLFKPTKRKTQEQLTNTRQPRILVGCIKHGVPEPSKLLRLSSYENNGPKTIRGIKTQDTRILQTQQVKPNRTLGYVNSK